MTFGPERRGNAYRWRVDGRGDVYEFVSVSAYAKRPKSWRALPEGWPAAQLHALGAAQGGQEREEMKSKKGKNPVSISG